MKDPRSNFVAELTRDAITEALTEAIEDRCYSNLPLVTAKRLAERLTRNGSPAVIWPDYTGTYSVEAF